MSTVPNISVEVHGCGDRDRAVPHVIVNIYEYAEGGGAAPRVIVRYHNSPSEDAALRMIEEHDRVDVKPEAQSEVEVVRDEVVVKKEATSQLLGEHDQDVEEEGIIPPISMIMERDEATVKTEATPEIEVKHEEVVVKTEAMPEVKAEPSEVIVRTEPILPIPVEPDSVVKKEETHPRECIKHSGDVQTKDNIDELDLTYFWDRLPLPIKYAISRLLVIKMEERNMIMLHGAWQKSNQIKCPSHMDPRYHPSRLKKVADVLTKWQRLFIAGGMKLTVEIDDRIDPSLIVRLADMVGSHANRIICSFESCGEDVVPFLKRLPRSVTLDVTLAPVCRSRRPSSVPWLRQWDRVVFPPNVRHACVCNFKMDDSSFRIYGSALQQLKIEQCRFIGTGCDFKGMERIDYLHLSDCYIESWQFFSKLPRRISRILFDSVRGDALNTGPQLPEFLEHLCLHNCEMKIISQEMLRGMPTSLQSIELKDSLRDDDFFKLKLPRNMSSFTMIFTDEYEEQLEITDRHINFSFPLSIRKIHIETNRSNHFVEQEYWRLKWISSLKEQHPDAEITIII